MKLYCFPIAPNPTRVRLYIAEKAAGGAEIPIEEVLVNLAEGEQTQPAHVSRNPFGSLPVLELDDGTHLIESEVIIEYLEEIYPKPALLGNDPVERARARQLERIAEVRVLGPIARFVHATNSPLGLPPNPALAAAAEPAFRAGLHFLNHTLSDGRPLLSGASPTLADCTLAAALQFARFRELEIVDPSLEHVARWDVAFRERPSAKAVLSI